MTEPAPPIAADAEGGENLVEALLASTSVLMAAYAGLGRCATTARGPERAAALARIVDNLALVDGIDGLFVPEVSAAVRRALVQWRELAAGRVGAPGPDERRQGPAGAPTGLASRLH